MGELLGKSWHVVPGSDLIDHDLDGNNCICGPHVDKVSRPDGTFGWIVSHHSLDGRET